MHLFPHKFENVYVGLHKSAMFLGGRKPNAIVKILQTNLATRQRRIF
jgi:hypothetical protein